MRRPPLGPRPVLRAGTGARVLIIGQALVPGCTPAVSWDDPSGDRLRQWLQLEADRFYDTSRVAIVPMGFCYPGRGKSGDLPPSPSAPAVAQRVVAMLPRLELVLLVGAYAQRYYLPKPRRRQKLHRVKTSRSGSGAGGILARATFPCRIRHRAITCGCAAIPGLRRKRCPSCGPGCGRCWT